MISDACCSPILGRSFILQGRLNREYLRFLWLYRKPDDDGDHMRVQLDDEFFEVMLDAMIRYLLIYPAREERSDGQEMYILPARLPEYGNENVLEESIGLGEAVVGTTGWFSRTHVPSGLIGRFLAFTASKIVSSGKCWQHGAHIRWDRNSNIYDVLLCETTIQWGGTLPAIAVCVKGTTAEARGVLQELEGELKSLIEHNVHGYPGLSLPVFEEREDVRSDEFQRHLRPYLDLQFANLTTILEKISRQSLRMFRAAFPSYCDRKNHPYPRLVLFKPVDPVNDQQTNTAKGAMQLRKTWDRWVQLCRSGGSCDFDLVFLCEHDFSEIRCGPEGKGYRVRDAPRVFKSLKPLIQVCRCDS